MEVVELFVYLGREGEVRGRGGRGRGRGRGREGEGEEGGKERPCPNFLQHNRRDNAFDSLKLMQDLRYC